MNGMKKRAWINNKDQKVFKKRENERKRDEKLIK